MSGVTSLGPPHPLSAYRYDYSWERMKWEISSAHSLRHGKVELFGYALTAGQRGNLHGSAPNPTFGVQEHGV